MLVRVYPHGPKEMMARPTNRETKRVLDSIQILNSETSLSSLPDRLLFAVKNTVSSEITAFDRWEGAGQHAGTEWFDPPDSLPSSLLEIFNAHVAEHPLVPRVVGGRAIETLRISDCVSPLEFERTDLFNEFYRRVGVHHQMSTRLEIEPELAYSCTLSRSRRDFGERDRVTLNILKPHLVNAIRISRDLSKLNHNLEHLESIATKGILVLSKDMRPVYLSQEGARMLDRFFGAQRSPGLPAELVDFATREYSRIRNYEYRVSEKLFVAGPRGAELQCRVGWNAQTHEISIILEEQCGFAVEGLRFLGVTERETEILHWMYKGKSDETIGILCGISTRTVQKHLEHIFRKLGVESRLSALQSIRELQDRQ